MAVNAVVEQHIRRNGAAQTVETIDKPTVAGATALGALVDMIAQQTRAFEESRNQSPFRIKRHPLRRS
jgi:hypothetical protein